MNRSDLLTFKSFYLYILPLLYGYGISKYGINEYVTDDYIISNKIPQLLSHL